MTAEVIETAEVMVGRARRAQEAVDAIVTRPRVLRATFHPTGMTATLSIEVAVVRASGRHRCETCGHRRVVYALSFTSAALANPDLPWKCAACWGLRA